MYITHFYSQKHFAFHFPYILRLVSHTILLRNFIKFTNIYELETNVFLIKIDEWVTCYQFFLNLFLPETDEKQSSNICFRQFTQIAHSPRGSSQGLSYVPSSCYRINFVSICSTDKSNHCRTISLLGIESTGWALICNVHERIEFFIILSPIELKVFMIIA